ncbi:ComEC/Rec2 family competence protein [Sphingosinicella rhizophila]|uniref:ComEC/Rec2 family competence protein n=1 Tax=Sphingosinicella rhizophila TaxID=3050082 RepID=A0ABU3Q254_9SPHN|nr:ComEC/Rec2 family competence protein [Sphingosinicella sp. GR2756]MDT9597501.1 ComEC/Rec2 family competence protein [Sphingosinicella sp. GR2756]
MTTGDVSAPSIADERLQTGHHGNTVAIFSRIAAGLEGLFERERDQLPIWLPVGVGLGVAAWFALPDARAWSAFLLIAMAAIVAPLALSPGTRWARAIAIFSLAAMIGCLNIWWKADRIAAPRLGHAQAVEFTGKVEAVQLLPAREAIRLLVRPYDAPKLPPKLRVNIDAAKAPQGLAAGAMVRLKTWLMPPAPAPVPGAYDFSRAAWFQQIGATGRAYEVEVVAPAGVQGWQARLATWRQKLASHVRSRLPGGEGGIAAALATGDQGGIPEEDAEALRRSGLAHLLSVSGLHLTAVVGAVMFLVLKLLALSPSLALRFRLVLIAAGAAALAGIVYTLLTGSEVPTVRACIASILVLGGIALGRDALTLRLVATGAIIVLLLWPDSLAGASFQLSFAAITAIVVLHDHPRIRALLTRRDEGLGAKLGRVLLALVLTGLAVEMALTPIALYHFHRSGLYGALANIIAIPLTTFVIMPFEALALLFDLFGLGEPFWWIAGQSLGLLLTLAHRTAQAPGAVTMLPSMPAAAFALMILGGLWLFLWRTSWRRWGLLPILVGAIWALTTPAPDLLITGDGRHMALRTAEGGLAILRGRAGDYVRDMLGEASGTDQEAAEIAYLRSASCSDDLCVTDIERSGRHWRILATRSSRFVDFGPLAQACAKADIVVSDRRLPRTCKPRWLKADRSLLRKTGGLAIVLGREAKVSTVAEQVGKHPWAPPAMTGRPSPKPSRFRQDRRSGSKGGRD